MDGTQPKPRLRDQVRAVIRVNRYSIRTEKSYWYWIRFFIRFHQLKHPKDMGPKEVNEFLTWLAVKRNVAAATQAQALNALVFLYSKVLDTPLGEIGSVIRSKKPKRLPVVLSHEEAMRIIESLKGIYRLLASLMYGSGLRVTEACRLRVKDIDFSNQVIIVRDGKCKRPNNPHAGYANFRIGDANRLYSKSLERKRPLPPDTGESSICPRSQIPPGRYVTGLAMVVHLA